MTENQALDLVSSVARDATLPALAVASANLDHVHHFGLSGRSHGHAMVDTAGLKWLNLLDGAPLVARARIATGRTWPRLAGSDLLLPILQGAERDGVSVGFLGGTKEMLTRLRASVRAEMPSLDVRGYWSPSRAQVVNPRASSDLADAVAASGVGILVVGLGKPRQEVWIQRNAVRSGARVLLAFGASADFLAGTASRAPDWVKSAGVEWLYRLSREPRRLARRYLLQGPPAAARVVGLPAISGELGPNSDRQESGRTKSATAIVVTHNSKNHIDRLLDSLPAAAPGLELQIVVVDNASTDGTADHVRSRGNAMVVETGRNAGYAGAINVGRTYSRPGEPLAILNPDLVLRPLALTTLVDTLADSTIGVAVPLLTNPDGSLYLSLRREPTLLRGVGDALLGARIPKRSPTWSDTVLDPSEYRGARDVEWASGAIWVVSGACNQAVGPWDERFFLYSEETEYARRVRRAGWRIRFEPAAVVEHVGAASGTSPDLCALMEVNRVADYAAVHGPLSSAAYRGINVLRQGLRSSSPGERRATRALLSPRLSREIFADERGRRVR